GGEPGGERRIDVRDAAEAVRILEELGTGKVLGAPKPARSVTHRSESTTRLGDLLDIHIGAVTGDAQYFLLSESERRDLGLPRACLRPVLSRCRHLQTAIMTKAEWQRLLKRGERVWLFSPPKAYARHPAVRRYLRQGSLGLCRISGFKIAKR